MAKKKVTHQPKPPQHHQEHTDNHHNNTTMDDPSEKLASLKSLNSILLKETVERRQQVEDLLHSKGSLESELSRSESEKEVLWAELTQLKDYSVGLELEKGLVRVFVDTQLGQEKEKWSGLEKEIERVREERDGVKREKSEIEMRLECLEREMREVVREKDGIEKARINGELEIGLLKKAVNALMGEVNNEKEVSSRVSRERDVIKNEHDVQIEVGNGLIVKVIEMEKRELKIQDEVRELKTKCKGLMGEKEENKRRIESLVSDKGSVERSLAESSRVINDLKREIEEIVREKKGIEGVRSRQEAKINELKKEVGQFNEIVSSLLKEEEVLRSKVLEMEKSSVEAVEKQEKMLMEINALVEEKRERERSFEALMGEKALGMKSLEESLKQLEDHKRMMQDMVRERTKIEEVKVQQESEFVGLQKEVSELRDALSALQESCRDQVEKNKQLLSEVSCYRDAFDQVSFERDSVQKGFDKEKKNGMNLRSKVLEMGEKIEDTLKELGQMRIERENLIEEKKELANRCEMLTEEKSSAQKCLLEAQQGIDDMRAKMESASANSKRVLTMLRNTAALVCLSKDEMNDKEDVFIDEQKIGEEIQPYVGELEAIRNAFRKREMKLEDMKRQLELQKSVVEAHKKKSFWTLVSSATTIFAAASVAYVARGR